MLPVPEALHIVGPRQARMPETPLLVVVGGPNGAGKSTTAPGLLRQALAIHEFVNADAIALGISAFRPESAALAAGRVMLERLRALSRARASFAFETTLANRSLATSIARLRGSGYRVHLMFLSLPTAELAVARVAERVRQGGHDVPVDVVRRRFAVGLRNFFGLYQGLVDSWQLYDNSLPSVPRRIAHRRRGGEREILDAAAWKALEEQCR